MSDPNPQSLEQRVAELEKRYDELFQQHIYIVQQYERVKKMFLRLSGVMRAMMEVDASTQK